MDEWYRFMLGDGASVEVRFNGRKPTVVDIQALRGYLELTEKALGQPEPVQEPARAEPQDMEQE